VEKLKLANNLKEIDLEENPIRGDVIDKIEAEIPFQILIRISERPPQEWDDMDWHGLTTGHRKLARKVNWTTDNDKDWQPDTGNWQGKSTAEEQNLARRLERQPNTEKWRRAKTGELNEFWTNYWTSKIGWKRQLNSGHRQRQTTATATENWQRFWLTTERQTLTRCENWAKTDWQADKGQSECRKKKTSATKRETLLTKIIVLHALCKYTSYVKMPTISVTDFYWKTTNPTCSRHISHENKKARVQKHTSSTPTFLPPFSHLFSLAFLSPTFVVVGWFDDSLRHFCLLLFDSIHILLDFAENRFFLFLLV